MDDFQGLQARDFGLRPQGKAAPMSAARSSAVSGSAWTNPRSASASSAAPAPSYDDLFGPAASATKAAPSPSIDSIFDSFKEPSAAAPPPKSKHPSMPVFDKPVYDDDIFDGVPGIKSSSARYDDVFGGTQASTPAFDDLLGGFGKRSEDRVEVEEKRKPEADAASTGFDDLLPGFGASSQSRQRKPTWEKRNKSPARHSVEHLGRGAVEATTHVIPVNLEASHARGSTCNAARSQVATAAAPLAEGSSPERRRWLGGAEEQS